jgi:hypothetical protein
MSAVQNDLPLSVMIRGKASRMTPAKLPFIQR